MRPIRMSTQTSKPTGAVPGAVRYRVVAAMLVASTLALTSCQYFVSGRQTRGNMIDKIDYGQLIPGTSSRADVTSLVGTPTTKATFDDNTWIYVGEVTEPVVAGFPAVLRQQVVVLNFDNGGTLQTVRKLTGKDAVRVAMVTRKTPSPGSDASILQQIIGNVGRYNPAGLLGSAGSNPNGSAGGGGGQGNSLPQ